MPATSIHRSAQGAGLGASVRNLSSAALIALMLPAGGHAESGPPLRYMFHLSPLKQAATGPRFVCPSLVVPLTDMSDMKKTFYAPGATQSVVDKAKVNAYVARTKALAQEKKILTSLVRAGATDPADHERVADCILRHIDNWAEASALLQNLDKNNPATHRQAIMTDISTVIGFANAYEAASDIAGVPQAQKELIGRWFRRLSDEIVREFTPPAEPRPKNFQRLDENSNHRYWAAAAVGVMAVHLQDRQRFDWSMNILRSALAEADSDGSLSHELQRGSKSLHYQNYAVQSLAILVRLADANGVRLSSEEEAKLSAIARFAAESYDNPAPLEKRVGAEQEKRPEMISWIGPLKDHFDRSDPQLAHYLAQLAALNKIGFDRACTVTCVTMLAELQAQKN